MVSLGDVGYVPIENIDELTGFAVLVNLLLCTMSSLVSVLQRLAYLAHCLLVWSGGGVTCCPVAQSFVLR
jgi:hypothetical protein